MENQNHDVHLGSSVLTAGECAKTVECTCPAKDMPFGRCCKASKAEIEYVARELVDALDNAFISTWQSTAAWEKQLDAARAVLKGQ